MGGNPQLHYALHLAERGFVTLAPDYPSFGDYPYTFPSEDGYVSGTMKAIYENTRAVDLLQMLRQVDSERIGCIGHSLGGHNTIFTSAFDTRIKAMVSLRSDSLWRYCFAAGPIGSGIEQGWRMLEGVLHPWGTAL